VKKFVPALAAAFIATIGLGAAAQAELINFSVQPLDGGKLSYTAPTGLGLDRSSAFDFDGTKLSISGVGKHDDSGLVPFSISDPTNPLSFVTLTPTDIMYGTGTGSAPLGQDVVKSWTNAAGDTFTETLTTVDSINRGTLNAITVTLSGTLSDTAGIFTKSPVTFILQANQFGGPGIGAPIAASFTNISSSIIPEPSTWVMMVLGFAGLGYAAVRRSAKEQKALAI
jgi:hypothetical protein